MPLACSGCAGNSLRGLVSGQRLQGTQLCVTCRSQADQTQRPAIRPLQQPLAPQMNTSKQQHSCTSLPPSSADGTDHQLRECSTAQRCNIRYIVTDTSQSSSLCSCASTEIQIHHNACCAAQPQPARTLHSRRHSELDTRAAACCWLVMPTRSA